MLLGTLGSWDKTGVKDRGDGRSVWDRWDQGQVDQESPEQGTQKGSSEGSGLTCILRLGERDGMGRWVQCCRGHWKMGLGQDRMGQDGRWGRLVPRGQMWGAACSQPGDATEDPSQHE